MFVAPMDIDIVVATLDIVCPPVTVVVVEFSLVEVVQVVVHVV